MIPEHLRERIARIQRELVEIVPTIRDGASSLSKSETG